MLAHSGEPDFLQAHLILDRAGNGLGESGAMRRSSLRRTSWALSESNPSKLLENHFLTGTCNPMVLDPIVFLNDIIRWILFMFFPPIEDFVLHTKVYFTLMCEKNQNFQIWRKKLVNNPRVISIRVLWGLMGNRRDFSTAPFWLVSSWSQRPVSDQTVIRKWLLLPLKLNFGPASAVLNHLCATNWSGVGGTEINKT